MNRSRSYLTVICLLIIAFLALQTGCSTEATLYVKILNCADDNIRIDTGATYLHLQPDDTSPVLLGFLDKNELMKEYKVSRSTGLCRKLSISVTAGDLKAIEDYQKTIDYQMPTPEALFKITEDDIEMSEYSPTQLTIVSAIKFVPSFQAILELCPQAWSE